MVSYLFCLGHGGGVRWKKGDENSFLEEEDFSMLMCGDKGKVLWAMSAAQVLHQIGQSKVCVLGENKMQQAYML